MKNNKMRFYYAVAQIAHDEGIISDVPTSDDEVRAFVEQLLKNLGIGTDKAD